MNNPDTATPNPSSTIVTGLIGIALVLVIAALIIGPFEHHFFTDWVAAAFMAATPIQVIIGLLWHNDKPEWASRLPQPLKGLALTAITVAVGALVLVLTLVLVGKGHGVSPMTAHYLILTIVAVMWLVPLWQCWPFTLLTQDPFKFGLMALVASYLLAYLVWAVFFNYAVLGQMGHPHYHASVDPGGIFDMWLALTFCVTTVAVIIVHILFDFWPIDKLSAGRAQPMRGIIGTIYILVLSVVIYFAFVGGLGMDKVDYMIRVPVCMIFGTFLVGPMMQFSLFPKLAQPVRGLALTGCAAIAAVATYVLYGLASIWHTGQVLGTGPEGGFARDIWIASAMLGITFPVVFLVSGFFGFWPIKRG